MATSHTPETRTTFTDILKNDFAPAIQIATINQTVCLSQFERVIGKIDAGGKNFIIPLEFNCMGSTGARAENGDLPDALPGIWSRSSVPIYYNYFSMAVSAQAMMTSDKDKFAFAEAWTAEIRVKQRAWQQQLNRQLQGDGNAILAQVDGTPSGTAITVDNAYGLSGYNNSPVNGGRFTTTQMKVDFYTGATIRDVGGVTIIGVTKGAFPTTSAILDVTGEDFDEVADGDYMYVAGAYGNEFPGMRLLIDDGSVAATFQGVSTATYEEWKSVVGYGTTSGTAEALTPLRMQNVQDDMETYNGGRIDWMMTSPAVWLTYGHMAAQENLITNARTLDSGWPIIEYNGKPIYKDPYSVDELYFIDNRCIKIHEAAPAGWVSQDGLTMRLDTTGTVKDRFAAYYRWFATPAMHNRSWCGKLVDIDVVSNKL